ncbi:MAG: HXXEE domain-containing protein [Acidobacteria bacterium]|nr:HXXEE domain-containing protein [Acidobacteriota bacterium]
MAQIAQMAQATDGTDSTDDTDSTGQQHAANAQIPEAADARMNETAADAQMASNRPPALQPSRPPDPENNRPITNPNHAIAQSEFINNRPITQSVNHSMPQKPRPQFLFLALVLIQAVHSAEEVAGRLPDVFPPARFISGLVSHDPQFGFLILNVLIVVFGIWCVVFAMRRNSAATRALMWGWAVAELINGVTHPVWTIVQRSYTPGVLTAPLLFVTAALLIGQLRRSAHD